MCSARLGSRPRFEVIGRLARERKLGSRAKEYLEKAQSCEVLAEQERDQIVRAALIHAARQWRDRALLEQRRTNASLPW
jgi:Lon protease-like protein